MSDGSKRGVRRFEPPPWEVEAFESLARKRAEEQEALEALATATRIVPDGATEDLVAEFATPQPTVAAEAQPTGEPVKPKKPAIDPDDPRVRAMLLELSREEAANTSGIKFVARAASAVTGLVGLGMLFGGVLAIKQAGGTAAGTMGSGALSVFGLSFVAMAAWVWVRSNSVKGSR